jgi:2-C-methyl-D-erythritol 4-phosphate cytidylyltransferase
MPPFSVILPAAGTGARFGADKLAQRLGGQSVLDRSVVAFLRRDDVAEVVLVGRSDFPDHPRLRRVPGGRCRAESVLRGLEAVSPALEWVAVHDAARPLVSQELIDRVFVEAVRRRAGVAPALPVHLTIKRASGPLPAAVIETVPRDTLWATQTPQAAPRGLVLEAFARCPRPLSDVTDDVQILELAGHPVWLVDGDERNLKITAPSDLPLAEALLAAMGAVRTE